MSESFPVTTCANHPNVETTLRCNRCDKPICPRCAVRTPTGYRCRECVRGQLRTFDTAQWYDYPLAFGVAAALSFAGTFVVGALGWFFAIFLSPVAGVIIAEAVRFVLRRRRSRQLYLTAAAGAALGSLPPYLGFVLAILAGVGGGGFLFQLITLVIYSFVVTSTVFYRLSGIQIRT